MKSQGAAAIVKDCYTEYALEVNGGRALPDSRDGFKNVQRRLLCTLALREPDP